MELEKYNNISALLDKTIKKIEDLINDSKPDDEIVKIINSIANNNFNKTDYDSFLSTLKVLIERIKKLKSLLNSNMNDWKNFNIQYQNYYINKLKRIEIEAEIFNGYNFKNITIFEEKNIINQIKIFYDLVNIDSVDDLYEHFKYGDKNYILFGKNGAGKTTLLNKISKSILNNNTVILKATRDINYIEDCYYRTTDLNLHSALVNNESGKPLFLLGQLLKDINYEQLRNNVNVEENIEKKAINIFNQLGLDRNLYLSSKGILQLTGNNIPAYNITSASDGERCAILIILSVLLSQPNSFVFIDEPENHLNGALMRKLFDSLETARPDIKFIFATHNIQFIQSRENAEKIYLEKTDKREQWKFKNFKSYDELPLEVILNIEGTNDNIIFCEGEDRNSLDCRLYEILFPNYEIVPAHGCENVKKQTDAINSHQDVFRKKAIGIIDNDFLNQMKTSTSTNNNIFYLPVNEIENVYILPYCIESIKTIIENGKSIEEIQAEIISKINLKKEHIKKDFATKLLKKLQMDNKFKNGSSIRDSLNTIMENNKEKFLDIYNDFENELENSISIKDYDKLLSLVPAKMIISDVAKIIGFSDENIYTSNVLKKIKEDSNLKEKLLQLIRIQ